MAFMDQAKVVAMMVVMGAGLLMLVRELFDVVAGVAKITLIVVVLYLIYLARTLLNNSLRVSISNFRLFSNSGGGQLASWADLQNAAISAMEFIRHVWRSFMDRPQ